jgi:hypothetical protein
MLDSSHYELLAKYEAQGEVEFDPNELALVCGILNLTISEFAVTRLREYRTLIRESIREQNKIMTDLSGELLTRTDGSEKLPAMRYWVQNIARIKSPYMLDILLGLCCGRDG